MAESGYISVFRDILFRTFSVIFAEEFWHFQRLRNYSEKLGRIYVKFRENFQQKIKKHKSFSAIFFRFFCQKFSFLWFSEGFTLIRENRKRLREIHGKCRENQNLVEKREKTFRLLQWFSKKNAVEQQKKTWKKSFPFFSMFSSKIDNFRVKVFE